MICIVGTYLIFDFRIIITGFGNLKSANNFELRSEENYKTDIIIT